MPRTTAILSERLSTRPAPEATRESSSRRPWPWIALALTATLIAGCVLALSGLALQLSIPGVLILGSVIAVSRGATATRGTGTAEVALHPSLHPALSDWAPLAARTVPARAVKRATDVAVAATALVVFLPLLALIALCVKLGDGGPVLFTQRRVGREGEPFTVFKFRTMHPSAHHPAWGGLPVKYREDGRITPVGRVLRRTSLDELPQLLNVLRGDMSIVGPRPLPLYEAPAVPSWAAARWAVRPGLTCTWQVSGRSEIPWEERMLMDSFYAVSWSAGADLGLMVRTCGAVISGRGAY